MGNLILGRRQFLWGSGAAVGAEGLFRVGLGVARAADLSPLRLQLGWFVDYNQTGEVVAQKLGYFAEEKLTLDLHPGGSTIDGVAIVASGQCQVGQTPSSPALMLASSHDIPMTAFAVGAQRHPFAFFSLPKNPVRTPQDMVGKKVGIQSTAQILLNALLKKNGIDPDKVEVVPIGYDMVPLLSGKVDAISGWVIDVGVLKSLGPDFITMKLWDCGIHLYSDVYYAKRDLLKSSPELLISFVRATARGWKFAYENRDKAVEFLVEANSNLEPTETRSGLDSLLKFEFDEKTAANGWGAMDPAIWDEQLKTYADLKQFSGSVPKLDDIMTMAILDATKDVRPKIG
jgi:NitT/TauT family transport system substrate-binding protein